MYKKIIYVLVLLLTTPPAFVQGQTMAVHALTNQVTTYYNSTGQVSRPTKVWCERVAATGYVSQTISLATANFTTIRCALVRAETSTGTLMELPYTTTTQAITINVPGGVMVASIVGQAVNFGIPTLFTGTIYNVLVLGD